MSNPRTDGYNNVTLTVSRDAASGPVLMRSTIPHVLPKNHVLLRVSRFGFSANNVTYQALGGAPHFRYFEFHPAPEESDSYAVVPVWGFGTVVASTAQDIIPGERVFGYLAPARFLLLQVDTTATNPFNFYVPRPHLPPDRRPYNQITRCARDALYAPAEEDFAMIYRPLFWTAFWAEDWLHGTSPAYSGAHTLLISSASARTAFCLAFCARRRGAVRIVGVTSLRNREFVEGLGLYDTVLVYEDVERVLLSVMADGAVLYVDVAGNDTLNNRVWNTLGGRVIRSVSLGITNLTPVAGNKYVMPPSGVTGPDPVQQKAFSFFFMPEHLAVRRGELGARGIAQMQLVAWKDLMRVCAKWGVPIRLEGAEEVRQAWERAVHGGGGGGVWSMWGEGEEEEEDLDQRNVESARL